MNRKLQTIGLKIGILAGVAAIFGLLFPAWLPESMLEKTYLTQWTLFFIIVLGLFLPWKVSRWGIGILIIILGGYYLSRLASPQWSDHLSPSPNPTSWGADENL